MRTLLCLFTTGILQFSFSQNDSILPNLSVTYHICTTTKDGQGQNFVYGVESFQFVNNNPSADTLSVLYNGDTIATLALDGDKVFIKRTIYAFNPIYVGFRDDFGNDYELLYDFSLNVGDTAYSQYSPNDAIVQSIDFVNVQGIQKKRLNFTTGESWIKGLGSTFHPLSPKMYYFEVGYALCSAEMEYSGGSIIDTSSYLGLCNCITGIDELNQDYSMIIFPNPTNQNEVRLSTIDEIFGYNCTRH